MQDLKKKQGQKPNTACNGMGVWNALGFTTNHRPALVHPSGIPWPCRTTPPSKVNKGEVIFFYQGGLKPRSVQNGYGPYADENAHKKVHTQGHLNHQLSRHITPGYNDPPRVHLHIPKASCLIIYRTLAKVTPRITTPILVSVTMTFRCDI